MRSAHNIKLFPQLEHTTIRVIFNVGPSLVKSELRLPTPISLSAAPPTKARVTMGNSPSDTFPSRALTSLSTSRSGTHNILSAQTRRFAMHNMRNHPWREPTSQISRYDRSLHSMSQPHAGSIQSCGVPFHIVHQDTAHHQS